MNVVGIVLIACAGLAPTGFREDPVPRRFEFRETHMGSEFTILLYSSDDSVARTAARQAFDRIAALNQSYNDYDPESEISKLSAQAGGPPIPVSADLFDILQKSSSLAEQTDGAFDVTIQPVVKQWRRARRMHELPTPEQLQTALQRTGWRKMILDPKARTVQLTLDGMGLDLGGIAKGYAADEALKVLKDHGNSRALVAGAGDVVLGDPPPGASGWVVGIANLEGPDGVPSRYLSLANAAVSTSGDTERFLELDGVRYSHIVDPRTGLGLTDRRSVTVIAPNGTTSDSFATALSVLSPQSGLAFLNSHPGVECLIVQKRDDRLDITTSPGFDQLPTARNAEDAIQPE